MSKNKINIYEACVEKSGHPCEPAINPVALDIRPTVFSQEPLSREPKKHWIKERSKTNIVSAILYLLYYCKRRHESYLELKDIEELWTEQKGKCFLTGRRLTAANISFDRQDNTEGYYKANVRLVTKEANIAKQSMHLTDFISLCEDVVRNNIKVKRPNE